MDHIPSNDISSYLTLIEIGPTEKIKYMIKSVIGCWRSIADVMVLITFSSRVQSNGGIHSYWTEVLKVLEYSPRGDGINKHTKR